MKLVAGEVLTIGAGDFVGDATRVSTSFTSLSQAVQPGHRLLLDDGRLQLEVTGTNGDEIVTRIVDGGLLGEHKGITVPNVTWPTSAVTDKDLDDLAFGMELGVDLVAVSFVQSAADLQRARDAMQSLGRVVPLIAKIERPQAVDRIDEILDVSDGVMVARGDLGLELPLERVPSVQKRITRRARRVGVPVIVATQVLESMIHLPRPTRAEVSDAANAVVDGVDAIMLAGETAVGAFPIQAIETLDRVARDAESDLRAAGPRRLRPCQRRGTGRPSAKPPSRSPPGERPMRSSRSREAAKRPACCRGCVRVSRSSRPPTVSRWHDG